MRFIVMSNWVLNSARFRHNSATRSRPHKDDKI